MQTEKEAFGRCNSSLRRTSIAKLPTRNKCSRCLAPQVSISLRCFLIRCHFACIVVVMTKNYSAGILRYWFGKWIVLMKQTWEVIQEFKGHIGIVLSFLRWFCKSSDQFNLFTSSPRRDSLIFREWWWGCFFLGYQGCDPSLYPFISLLLDGWEAKDISVSYIVGFCCCRIGSYLVHSFSWRYSKSMGDLRTRITMSNWVDALVWSHFSNLSRPSWMGPMLMHRTPGIGWRSPLHWGWWFYYSQMGGKDRKVPLRARRAWGRGQSTTFWWWTSSAVFRCWWLFYTRLETGAMLLLTTFLSVTSYNRMEHVWRSSKATQESSPPSHWARITCFPVLMTELSISGCEYRVVWWLERNKGREGEGEEYSSVYTQESSAAKEASIALTSSSSISNSSLSNTDSSSVNDSPFWQDEGRKNE